MKTAKNIVENASNVAKYLFKKNNDINYLLESKNHIDVMDALFTLFESIGQNKDLSLYYPAVIKLVAWNNFDIQRLASIFISEYCQKYPDISLLCVSTLQKGLKNHDHIVRAFCMKTLIHIQCNLIIHIKFQAIKNCISDSSSYLKRIACIGLISLLNNNDIDNDINKDDIFEILLLFINSTSIIVFGTSLYIFYLYFKDKITFLHDYFFRICDNLKYIDQLYLPFIIDLLLLYTRTFFKDTRRRDSKIDINDFEKDENEIDFEYMISSVTPLLSHNNSSVVFSIVRFIRNCAPPSYMELTIEPLMYLLTDEYIRPILIHNIELLIIECENIFDNIGRYFYIGINDDLKTKIKKLDILVLLINDKNYNEIIDEFKIYVNYPYIDFACYAVNRLKLCAIKNTKSVQSVLEILLELLQTKRKNVLSETVVAFRTLLQIHNNNNSNNECKIDLNCIVRKMLIVYEETKDNTARESIIWVVKQYCDELKLLVPDMIRLAAKSYRDDTTIVRLQTLDMAAKLYVLNKDEIVQSLCNYIFLLAKYDINYDIRDRYRLINTLINSQCKNINDLIQKIFFNKIQNTLSYSISSSSLNIKNIFIIGSISCYFCESFKGYNDLPNFALSSTPADIRRKKRIERTKYDEKYDEIWHNSSSDDEEIQEESDSSSLKSNEYEEVEEDEEVEENEEVEDDEEFEENEQVEGNDEYKSVEEEDEIKNIGEKLEKK